MNLPVLSSNKRKVAYWSSLGADPKVIASKVGLTLTTVRNMLSLEEVQQYAAMFRSGELDDMMEIRGAQRVLEGGAPRAAERVLELMEIADKDATRLRAAETVLDRTGFAKQIEIRRQEVYIDAEMYKLLKETERMLEIPEADFEVIEDGQCKEDERGDSGDSDKCGAGDSVHAGVGRGDDVQGRPANNDPSRKPSLGVEDEGSELSPERLGERGAERDGEGPESDARASDDESDPVRG